MTHTNELEKMNARNSHIWLEGGVKSGRPRSGHLFNKCISCGSMIAALCMTGCVSNKLDAIANCDDTAILEEIAINARPAGCHAYVGNTVYAGLEAAKKVENRAALEKICNNAKSPAVRNAAAERLTGRTALTEEDALVDAAISACPAGAHGYAENTVYHGIAAIARLQELGATNSLERVSVSAKLPALRKAAAR